MEIFECGSSVVIKLASKRGIITCCAIRFDKVIYEITYYSGDDQKTIWVNEKEFEITEPETQKIGFKKLT
jgi:hypothetical protein